jgi:hypothetical protein
MEAYIAAYAFYLFFAALGLTQKNPKPLVTVGLAPMIFLVLLRGYIGVDTPMYVQSIEKIQNSGVYTAIFEPGFEYLVLGASTIVSDPLVITKVIAMMTTLLLLCSNWSPRINAQVIVLGVIPYFYLDMTMNGLRYGMAFAISLFALNSFIRKRSVSFFFWSLLAVSMQVSALYISGLLQVLFRYNWKNVCLLLIAAALVGFFGSDYLLSKATANAELFIASPTAGLAPLLMSVVCLLGCWGDVKIRTEHRLKIVIVSFLTIGAYVLTQITYAGLRLQQLNLFGILLFIICICNASGQKKSKSISVALVFLCILGSVFRLNNFNSEAGSDTSSFAPYRFYWQE